jgi:hypothetical protein
MKQNFVLNLFFSINFEEFLSLFAEQLLEHSLNILLPLKLSFD